MSYVPFKSRLLSIDKAYANTNQTERTNWDWMSYTLKLSILICLAFESVKLDLFEKGSDLNDVYNELPVRHQTPDKPWSQQSFTLCGMRLLFTYTHTMLLCLVHDFPRFQGLVRVNYIIHRPSSWYRVNKIYIEKTTNWFHLLIFNLNKKKKFQHIFTKFSFTSACW